MSGIRNRPKLGDLTVPAGIPAYSICVAVTGSGVPRQNSYLVADDVIAAKEKT